MLEPHLRQSCLHLFFPTFFLPHTRWPSWDSGRLMPRGTFNVSVCHSLPYGRLKLSACRTRQRNHSAWKQHGAGLARWRHRARDASCVTPLAFLISRGSRRCLHNFGKPGHSLLVLLRSLMLSSAALKLWRA